MNTTGIKIQNSLKELTQPLSNNGLHQSVPSEDFVFLKGVEWQNLSSLLREEYLEQAFRYWKDRGFPYYQLNKSQIRRQFHQLAATSSERMFLPNSEIQWSNVGLALANYFHPQMWSVQSDTYLSPVQCFNDDERLKACIHRALQIWPDRYGTNPSNMRRMLSSFTNTKRVSNFRPTVAKAIYERYSSQLVRVLDFCAGFGGRLLGCLVLERHYVGYESNRSQFLGLKRMHSAIHGLGYTSCYVDLKMGCAEDLISKEASHSFDLVFTSPPYFNRERYSSDTGQSYVRYKDYITWRVHFLHHLIRESWRVLRKEGILVLNVANTEHAPIAEDTEMLARPYFDLIATHRLRLGRLPYRRGVSTGAYHYEPIFVFAKRE